jgi:UDPglucose--hexose-1-phosphate uridylyltransferase
MAQIRKDFLLDRFSIISELRGKRPHHFEPLSKEKDTTCFFCPGNEKLTPPTIDIYPKDSKIGKNADWRIRVFRNKFPALKPKKGDHEIIVETPEHGQPIEELSPEDLVPVFLMYERRRMSLENKYKYAFIFKNSGREAGASLPHSHTQILASDEIPPVIAQEAKASKDYYKKKGNCPWCDYLGRISRRQTISSNSSALAFCPDAPRFSFESWVMPKEHAGTFSDLDEKQQLDLCGLLKETIISIKKVLGEVPYNMVLHHAPKGNPKNYHFHIEILPRAATHAGFELGGGAYIISRSPESASKLLRKQI